MACRPEHEVVEPYETLRLSVANANPDEGFIFIAGNSIGSKNFGSRWLKVSCSSSDQIPKFVV